MSQLTDYMGTLKVGDDVYYLITSTVYKCTVKSIWKNGTVITVNGVKFHRDGTGKWTGLHWGTILTPERALVIIERNRLAKEDT